MIKKLCIIFLTLSLVVPAVAQQSRGGNNASFAPQKGNWQVDMIFGSSRMFDEDTDYLLYEYGDTNIGLDNWNQNQSQDPSAYLNLGSISSNSLANIVGLQASYFITNQISVNAAFSMNITSTPNKDYVEGDDTVGDMVIPGNCYVEGELTNNWSTSIGSNYYFNTKNERINLYAGVLLGYQMGRIRTQTPYTGETVYDSSLDEEVDQNLYYSTNNAGQLFGANASLVAGIEYSLAKGFVLGFEVRPASYSYYVLEVKPYGYETFRANVNNIQILALPNVKLGFRF